MGAAPDAAKGGGLIMRMMSFVANSIGTAAAGLCMAAIAAGARADGLALDCGPATGAAQTSQVAAFSARIHQDTQRVPVGGRILVDVTTAPPTDGAYHVIACAPVEGRAGDLAIQPQFEKSDGVTTTYGFNLPDWVRRDSPIVRLRVRRDSDGQIADYAWRLSVSSQPVAAALAFAALALAWGFILWVARKREGIGGAVILRMISSPGGHASLSQFQVALWTTVIGTGAVYVMALSWSLIDVPAQTLMLLGIAGAGVLGAGLATRVPGTVGSAPTGRPGEAHVTSWADLFIWDGQNQIDITRVQMFVFTLISAGFVAVRIYQTNSIPQVPDGMVELMGLSNGVYITAKFLPNTQGAAEKPDVQKPDVQKDP